MSCVRRLFAVLAGVLLLQGYLEVSSLACALRHGMAAEPADSSMTMTAGATAAGTDHGHESHAACTANDGSPDAGGVPCGSGPMSPTHCAGMHVGSPAVASVWPLDVEPDERGPGVAADLRQRPLSRSSGPDVPPPRA